MAAQQYEALARIGMDYGPCFTGVVELRCRVTERTCPGRRVHLAVPGVLCPPVVGELGWRHATRLRHRGDDGQDADGVSRFSLIFAALPRSSRR